MKKLVVFLLLSSLMVLSMAPSPAGAGTAALWPSQFSPATWSVSLATIESFARKNFHWLGATAAAGAAYESEVRLPVGASVTEFAVNASTVSQPAVEAVLLRAKLGGAYESVAQLTLQGANDRAWYPTTGITEPRVAAGYKYWVHVDVFGDNAFVYGVRVKYR